MTVAFFRQVVCLVISFLKRDHNFNENEAFALISISSFLEVSSKINTTSWNLIKSLASQFHILLARHGLKMEHLNQQSRHTEQMELLTSL